MTQAKAKSNSVITTKLDGSLIVFTVKGGKGFNTIKNELEDGELVLDLARLHGDISAKALVHGMVQRVADAAAIPRDTKTGKSASPQEKLEAMAELVNHYNSGSGDWRIGGKREGRSFLLLALCEFRADKTREELQEWLKALTDNQKKALENDPRIKPKIDTMRAQGTEQVDTEELLAGLG